MAKATAGSKKEAAFSPLKTGSDPRKDNPNKWLKLEVNKSVDAVILVENDDIISCEQCAIWVEEGQSPVWVYTGADDPSHELGVKRQYRAYLPVLVAGEVKVWGMGKSAHIQIIDLAEALGTIAGSEVRLKRTGAGINTKYSVTGRGIRHDISEIDDVDVVELLGPLTPEGVRELIADKFDQPDYETFLASYRGKKRSAGKKKATPVEEDIEEAEEESLEDVKLV